MVAFPKKKDTDERLIGITAKLQKRRNINNSYDYFIRFLGINKNSK